MNTPAFQRLQHSVNQLKSSQNVSYGLKRAAGIPNFQQGRVSSSRPSSGRGVTFHMKHSFVSKGMHESKGQRESTTAAKHQAYIERESAVARHDGPGPEEDRQRTLWDQGRDSFGVLGNKKADREQFWRDVEESEGRKGRVQSRIILELPYECSDAGRRKIANEFCTLFREKNLPYWCSIHAPYDQNDARNYHMHINYHDRPAEKKGDVWDFTIEEKKRYKNRSIVTHRPYQQNKDRDCQGPPWIKKIRNHFAECANRVLAEEGLEKRYDPRPYRESFMDKEPTRHLGTKASAFERRGMATRYGNENRDKEIEWRSKERIREGDEHTQWTQRLSQKGVKDDVLDTVTDLVEQRNALKEHEIHLTNQFELETLHIQRRKNFIIKETESLLHPKGHMTITNQTERDKMAEELNMEMRLIRETELENQAEQREREEERKRIILERQRLDRRIAIEKQRIEKRVTQDNHPPKQTIASPEKQKPTQER